MQCRTRRSDPWVRKIPGEGSGNPLQCSCLGNPLDRGAWWATVHEVARVGHDWVTKSSPRTEAHLLHHLSIWKQWSWALEPRCFHPGTFILRKWRLLVHRDSRHLYIIRCLPCWIEFRVFWERRWTHHLADGLTPTLSQSLGSQRGELGSALRELVV